LNSFPVEGYDCDQYGLAKDTSSHKLLKKIKQAAVKYLQVKLAWPIFTFKLHIFISPKPII